MIDRAWHGLLIRQIRKLLGDQPVPDEWRRLLDVVSQAYHQADADRLMLERSLDLNSQELLQANRDLRAIFDLWPDTFFRTNRDGIILDCNMERTLGMSHVMDLRGRRISEAPASCPGSEVMPMLAEAGEAGRMVVREVEHGPPDHRRFAEISVIPLPPQEYVVFVRDITSRRRAEEQGRRLAAAVEQAADAVLITDTKGVIQYVNPAFEHILGYSRDDVIGRTPALLKSGRHDAQFYKKLWHAIQSGRVWKGRFTDRRKDGSLVEMNTAISPIREPGGAIVNYIAVSHDVSREVELEEQLRQAAKMEAIGRLAGGIAHDFNNLLTSMIGNADLALRRVSATTPVRADIELIRDAAQRAAGLVSQLLTFSRKQVVHPRVLQLNEVVSNMARLLKRTLGHTIELEVDLDAQPLAVRADPIQMEQVIMNLALNARDAMPNGGRLTLKTRDVNLARSVDGGLPDLPPGLYARLSVVDTGVGMDAGTKSRLFEPFFTTKEVGRGTGLGLATVYGIVQQSGGALHVESEPGKGATFDVYLPQARIATATQPGVVREEPAARVVLVVDDEAPVRHLVSRMLVEAGFQVMEASHGQEGLEIVRSHRDELSLVISDVVMSRFDGKTFASAIQAEYPRLPVILMSGHPDARYAGEAGGVPNQYFIVKPFTGDQLLAAVRHALAVVG